jgi:glycine/D-amino acid oxidase-like deaminating enzyme
VLSTAEGRLLTAGQAVFCTGYEFLPSMESPAHQIISTWALASETNIRRPPWLDDMLVWEAEDPYLYFRTAQDGRIIAGGEDENDPVAYRDPARMKMKAVHLAAKLENLCGIKIGRPAYVWAAPFGNTVDGLPIIDRVPGMRRVHAVMGFGGNGITYSMIAAQIVAARLAGRRDPDEDLFAFR